MVRQEREGHSSIYTEASRATQEFFTRNVICVEEILETRDYSLQESRSLLEQAKMLKIEVEKEKERLFDPDEEVSEEENLNCLATIVVAKFIREHNQLYLQEEERRMTIIKERLKACGFPPGRKISKPMAWFNYHFRAPLVMAYWRLKKFSGL